MADERKRKILLEIHKEEKQKFKFAAFFLKFLALFLCPI
jgi:hypothetical protein